jgi:hypothetical protein
MLPILHCFLYLGLIGFMVVINRHLTMGVLVFWLVIVGVFGGRIEGMFVGILGVFLWLFLGLFLVSNRCNFVTIFFQHIVVYIK